MSSALHVHCITLLVVHTSSLVSYEPHTVGVVVWGVYVINTINPHYHTQGQQPDTPNKLSHAGCIC
jgi:hypothetical protein